MTMTDERPAWAVELDEELADLARECEYTDGAGFPDEKPEYGDTIEGLINYKDALEERVYALTRKLNERTPEATPVEDGGVVPRTDEQVAPAWSELIRECAEEHGTPNFAWHMAERGCAPREVRGMARRWRDEQFEPAKFAAHLDLFADAVVAVAKTEGDDPEVIEDGVWPR
jgi:hypothetical protein